MQVKIFTLPFDEKTEGFDDELIRDFCLNKRVHRIETHFFRQEGRAYWSVAVHYDVVDITKVEKVRDLDESQQLLYERLRTWRREAGTKAGIPVYLIATNAQLVQMIKMPIRTLDGFKTIKGFGKSHVSKYGRTILGLIKAFYEEQPRALESAQAESPNVDVPPFMEEINRIFDQAGAEDKTASTKKEKK